MLKGKDAVLNCDKHYTSLDIYCIIHLFEKRRKQEISNRETTSAKNILLDKGMTKITSFLYTNSTPFQLFDNVRLRQ